MEKVELLKVLKKYLYGYPEFEQQVRNIIENDASDGIGRMESEKRPSPRGPHFMWVEFKDGVLSKIGGEEGNYAGGTIWYNKELH